MHMLIAFGSKDQCEADELDPLPHRIPVEVLPSSMPEAVQHVVTTKSIPDAFMYKPKRGSQPAEYWIVELKYCRDTDREGKLEKARNQHRELHAALKTACEGTGGKVHYMTLLVGVSGSIFKSTVTQLKELGINGTALQKVIKSIHQTAVNTLHWIYTTKMKKEKSRSRSTSSAYS